jgi:hypothetical protein
LRNRGKEDEARGLEDEIKEILKKSRGQQDTTRLEKQRTSEQWSRV